MNENLQLAIAIQNKAIGTTDIRQLNTAQSELTDVLLAQKAKVKDAHKAVNRAKEAEEDEKDIVKKIEKIIEDIKGEKAELKYERYQTRP